MIRYFSRHPTAANLMMVTLILLGLVALPNLKRETFPEFASAYIVASVVYPGASPQEVEQRLCLLMETAIDGLGGIEETRCAAVEGSASLTMKLTDYQQMGRMLIDVQTKINAIRDFPKESELPIVRELDWSEPVIDIAIQAELNPMALHTYAEQLKRQLQQDYGVPLVRISGFSQREWQITLDELALHQLELSVADVAQRIVQQNQNTPLGELSLVGKNMLLRFDQQANDINQLKNIVIFAQPNGAMVRLKDIATLSEDFDHRDQAIQFDGSPAAMLKISKNKADDALKIKDSVTDFVKSINATAPQGVTLTLTNDLSSILWDRLTMMVKNGWQGVLLVFLVMWLFFSFRYSFWIAAGLPVAFFGSLFLMAQLGLSINIMSLVALLMAIGIMMDDAIVIAESIAHRIDQGESIDDAVVKGVKSVFPGVLSSYLTTLCIFGSLIFLKGEMGAVLRVIPQVLILVLTISLFEAFLILPFHLRHSLAKAQNKSQSTWRIKREFLRAFERVRQGSLQRAIRWSVKHRYGVVSGTFLLLCLSFAMIISGGLKFVSFPELDGDVAEARILLPPGSTQTQMKTIVEKVKTAALAINHQWKEQHHSQKELVVHMTELYGVNGDVKESGQHIATVRLDLLGSKTRDMDINVFLSRWEQEVGLLSEPIAIVFKQPFMGPGGADIKIQIQHDDLDILKAASIEIQSFLKGFHGVSGVLDDMRLGKPEQVLRLDERAHALGVTSQMITSQLRAAYYGANAGTAQQGLQSVDIVVMLAKEDQSDLSVLRRFPIVLPDGTRIPLATLVHFESQREYVRIQRKSGQRTLSVFADLDAKKITSGDIWSQFNQSIKPALKEKYPNLRFGMDGAAKDSAKTGSSMGTGFAIGLFGIFVILSYQFRSYVEPIVVLLAIPLAFIGVIWGHWLLGFALSMPSLMGFVSLSGVVVNDSILLVQSIRRHFEEGEHLHLAVVSAGLVRFRAVFLTSLTTAAGLLPLLLETSLQAQVLQPLVIAIVFGVFTSTLLVLFVIPSAYAILSDFGRVHRHDT